MRKILSCLVLLLLLCVCFLLLVEYQYRVSFDLCGHGDEVASVEEVINSPGLIYAIFCIVSSGLMINCLFFSWGVILWFCTTINKYIEKIVFSCLNRCARNCLEECNFKTSSSFLPNHGPETQLQTGIFVLQHQSDCPELLGLRVPGSS